MSQSVPDKRKVWLVMAGVLTSLLLSALDSTIVGTAMPRIIGDLHGVEHYAWPFTAYMMCSTIAIIVFGKMSDIFGRRPVLLLGIIGFVVASALCGLSRNMSQLILFRGLQGLGAGILIPLSFIIVGDLFPPRERGKYTGLLSSMFGLASVAGPLLGGVITDTLSWRWVFYVNIPLGIVAICLVASSLPNIRHPSTARSIDYLGILTVTAALVSLTLGLAGNDRTWLSAPAIGLLAGAALLLALFVLVEKRAVAPILPPFLFRESVFSVSSAVMFLSNAVMFCGILYMPLLIQGVIGTSAISSGLVTAPMMLGLSAATIIGGQVISRTGRYKTLALAGLLLCGLGMIPLTMVGPNSSLVLALAAAVLLGIGCGIPFPVFNVAAQNAFTQRELGTVTASMQFFRNVGATIATSIFGHVMTTTMDRGFARMDLGHVPQQAVAVLKNPRVLANAQGLAQVKGHIPAAALPAFEQLVSQAKMVFARSLHSVFVAGILAAVMALLVTLLLRELPLKKTLSTGQPEVAESEP